MPPTFRARALADANLVVSFRRRPDSPERIRAIVSIETHEDPPNHQVMEEVPLDSVVGGPTAEQLEAVVLEAISRRKMVIE